jgi:hypothetical protein
LMLALEAVVVLVRLVKQGQPPEAVLVVTE